MRARKERYNSATYVATNTPLYIYCIIIKIKCKIVPKTSFMNGTKLSVKREGLYSLPSLFIPCLFLNFFSSFSFLPSILSYMTPPLERATDERLASFGIVFEQVQLSFYRSAKTRRSKCICIIIRRLSTDISLFLRLYQ